MQAESQLDNLAAEQQRLEDALERLQQQQVR